MQKTIVFPGTFDPITLGHEDLIARANDLFDAVIIAVASEGSKHTRFSLAQRLALANQAVAGLVNVQVLPMEGLLVHFLKDQKTHWILRGMRNDEDKYYEQAMLGANRLLMPEIEVVYLWSKSELMGVTSSAVREILSHSGDISAFVSPAVLNHIPSFEEV